MDRLMSATAATPSNSLVTPRASIMVSATAEPGASPAQGKAGRLLLAFGPNNQVVTGRAEEAGIYLRLRSGVCHYILFSVLQWARIASPQAIFNNSEPLYVWRERILDLYDGFARNIPTA